MTKAVTLCRFDALTTHTTFVLDILPDCEIYIVRSGDNVYMYDGVSAIRAIEKFCHIATAELKRRAAEKLLRENRNFVTGDYAESKKEKELVRNILAPYLKANPARIGSLKSILNGEGADENI